MACTWRIRHKLMLGLSLVVAIMALLLGGTLWGLTSYRSAMSTCESKLKELELAGKVREKILRLPGPYADADLPQRARLIQAQIPKIEEALHDYDLKLKETLDRNRAPDGGKDEQDHVKLLAKALTKLQNDLLRADTDPTFAPGGDQIDILDERSPVKIGIRNLETEVNDLIGKITFVLDSRIAVTKQEARKSIMLLITTGILAILVMTGLLRFFYRWVAQPIRDLEQGVSRVARGDFQHQIEIHSGDEIEDLARSYNEMTQKLRAMYENLAQQVNERSRQLVRSERLAGVGFLAAGVAHEINNPLASIAFSSEALESRLAVLLQTARVGVEEKDTIVKYLKMIQEEAFRCKEITQKLLAYSRGGERTRERTDLVEVIQGVLDMVKHLQSGQGKKIDFRPTGPLFAWVNGQEIKQVFLNLVINALENMDDGGQVVITARISDGQVEVFFKDTGCGMTPDVLENIFEPFFTRSRTGKGTGLGLSITHRIISSHGGDIEAASEGPGTGSTFRVRLPIEPPAQTAETGQEVQDPVEEFLKLSSAKRNVKAA
ncbi:MAG: HAMP domain-containing protein [Planctomycetes bacterium]|nr:HAMP domain-containing protein [Planctomycetota bacterium]